eukprot:CAMPEP_0185213530 /NCGR_PEP_ID=MMETSP1140-20130426/68079_1 /TAXON_ID=298111 /ORGANISM="Pavlova sp., Strain CCMP459" /LENGTH=121 /DNA_ID=CAMNT_0027781389 /DNA_START=415 /DNA_END=777 /DNA_ORIENTATION=+
MWCPSSTTPGNAAATACGLSRLRRRAPVSLLERTAAATRDMPISASHASTSATFHLEGSCAGPERTGADVRSPPWASKSRASLRTSSSGAHAFSTRALLAWSELRFFPRVAISKRSTRRCS